MSTIELFELEPLEFLFLSQKTTIMCGGWAGLFLQFCQVAVITVGLTLSDTWLL